MNILHQRRMQCTGISKGDHKTSMQLILCTLPGISTDDQLVKHVVIVLSTSQFLVSLSLVSKILAVSLKPVWGTAYSWKRVPLLDLRS